MDTVNKYGQTVLNMKVCGQEENRMVKVKFGMLMAMYSMVNGRTIKLMVLESTHI